MNLTCFGFLFIFECTMPTPRPAITVCPPVQNWSGQFQQQLADEVEHMPEGSAAERAIREHVQMRDRARKCIKARRR